MITKNEAKELTVGTILLHATDKNLAGQPRMARVTGYFKSSKLTPRSFAVPICVYTKKHTNIELTEANAHEWTIKPIIRTERKSY